MRFDVLTIFPKVINSYTDASILGRAQKNKIVELHVWDIREYTGDNHKTVDDTPYGGGPGMILKLPPIHKTLEAVSEETRYKKQDTKRRRTVVMSARGEQFTQKKAEQYAGLDSLTLICGRYEGIDQRVIDHLADEELSIGPYILAGGELAALIVIEATARLIPGVLGNPESLIEESHSTSLPSEAQSDNDERSWEYPQYTKPEEYNDWAVPKILLSGNHQEIKRWRDEHSQINSST